MKKILKRVKSEMIELHSVLDYHSFMFGFGVCCAVLYFSVTIGRYLGTIL